MTETQTQFAGFYADVSPHSHPNGGQLKLALGTSFPPGMKQSILDYLRAGRVFMTSTGIVIDHVDGKTVIGAPRLATDGVWVWPVEFAHYVEKYDVAVPEAFVQHMQRAGWKHPALNRQAAERVLRDTLAMKFDRSSRGVH